MHVCMHVKAQRLTDPGLEEDTDQTCLWLTHELRYGLSVLTDEADDDSDREGRACPFHVGTPPPPGPTPCYVYVHVVFVHIY